MIRVVIDETRLGYAIAAMDSDYAPDSYQEWQQLWLDSVPGILLGLYGCGAFQLSGTVPEFGDTTVDLVGDPIAEPEKFPSGMAIWLETTDQHTRIALATYHSPQAWRWIATTGDPAHNDHSVAALVRGIAYDLNEELRAISAAFGS